MSYGDEIMAAGQAAKLSTKLRGRIAILGRNKNVRWHDLWRDNPSIATPDEERQGKAVGYITNGPGCRPYIHYQWNVDDGVKFTAWRARDNRGSIFVSRAERDAATEYKRLFGKYIVIEPNLSTTSNPNKDWGWDNWRTLVSRMYDYRFVQLGDKDIRELPNNNVVRVHTTSFRMACIVLAGAEVLIAPEGGLHHAAAAMNKRAVVIFGGHTSPETTGYLGHRNIYYADNESPCGQWVPCTHCELAMAEISVQRIRKVLKEEYSKSKTTGALWHH